MNPYPTCAERRRENEADRLAAETEFTAAHLARAIKAAIEVAESIHVPHDRLMSAVLDGYDLPDVIATLRAIAPRLDADHRRELRRAAMEEFVGVVL